MHSLGIVQWNSTRRYHPGYLGRVSGTGPVTKILIDFEYFVFYYRTNIVSNR